MEGFQLEKNPWNQLLILDLEGLRGVSEVS
jgi:hypothetical protein